MAIQIFYWIYERLVSLFTYPSPPLYVPPLPTQEPRTYHYPALIYDSP
jgi:hypothetical protein